MRHHMITIHDASDWRRFYIGEEHFDGCLDDGA